MKLLAAILLFLCLLASLIVFAALLLKKYPKERH